MWEDKWNFYKNTFISEDGRVIDHQNNSVSHSEGQGYGMLLSVLFDDRECFDKLWKWTKDNLQKRKGDSLLAWSWGKHPSGKWTVIDYNNATDGDTLIAYALCLAGRKWGNEQYLDEAKIIIKDIKDFLIIKKDEHIYLLPGYYGFYKEDFIILNPSYYILPAYKTFASVEDNKFWNSFYVESLNFLNKIRFGEYRLPSDWVIFRNGTFSIFSEKSDNFGIEAIRIPLYALMAEEPSIVEKFGAYLGIIERFGYVPKQLNLKLNSIASQEGMAMHYIIVSALAKKLGKTPLADSLMEKGINKLEQERNYYSYTLSLLTLKWVQK